MVPQNYTIKWIRIALSTKIISLSADGFALDYWFTFTGVLQQERPAASSSHSWEHTCPVLQTVINSKFINPII